MPRYTLAEIVARHEVASGLTDVFVEGVSDARLAQGVAEFAKTRVDVFAIDRVEVPAHIVAFHGATEGNRGRVIAAARELMRLGLSPSRKIVFVADSDSDLDLRAASGVPILRYTRASDFGMYVYDHVVAARILRLNTSLTFEQAEIVLSSIESACRVMFAVRAIARRLGRNTPIPRARSLLGQDYPLEGRSAQEISTIVGQAMPNEVQELIPTVLQETDRMTTREAAGSHCMFGELAAFLRRHGGNNDALRDETSLRILFSGAVQFDALAADDFFRNILFMDR